MTDIRTQVLAMLSVDRAMTFHEIVDELDYSDLPPRKGITGKPVGPHSLVMEVIQALLANDVIAEQLTANGFTYRLSLGGWCNVHAA